MYLRLASAFQPVLRPDGKIVGREALLRAGVLEHGQMAPEAAFEEAPKANRVVQFDRLVRTLHLLNQIGESASGADGRAEEAVNNYRSLGYCIAVDNFGAAHSGLERVLELRPDIVKLDGALIRSAAGPPPAARGVKFFSPLRAQTRLMGRATAPLFVTLAKQQLRKSARRLLNFAPLS